MLWPWPSTSWHQKLTRSNLSQDVLATKVWRLVLIYILLFIYMANSINGSAFYLFSCFKCDCTQRGTIAPIAPPGPEDDVLPRSLKFSCITFMFKSIIRVPVRNISVFCYKIMLFNYNFNNWWLLFSRCIISDKTSVADPQRAVGAGCMTSSDTWQITDAEYS